MIIFFPQNMTGGKKGGLHITDITNASRTMLLNLKTQSWDPYLCKYVWYFSPTGLLFMKLQESAEFFWEKNLKKTHHVKTVLSPIWVTHSNGCTYQEYLQKHYDCHKSSIHLRISINQLFFFLTCYILLIVVFRFFSIPMSVLPTVKSSSEIYGKLVRQLK